MTLGRRLQSLPKFAIYAMLFILTTIPLFVPMNVPNKPDTSTIDFYQAVMRLPEGSRILLASDWTNSTRGESGGQFTALIRILARKKIKAAIYSVADPQAPQVAIDAIGVVNAERRKAGLPEWKRWDDWVKVGYFPQAESALSGISNNLVGAFQGKRDTKPGSGDTDVFQSPPLAGARSVKDFPLLVLITASQTSTFTVERMSGKLPLAFMVTGVMGPESQVFYNSRQIVGLSIGTKGVYDMETLMESGVNVPGKDGKVTVVAPGKPKTPGFPGQPNIGRGTLYYPTLHFALAALILMVILGNVGMFLSKRGGGR